MSAIAVSADAHRPARKRRPCRRQIPSLDATEGRAQGVRRVTSPPRRIGRGGAAAERRMVSDQLIEDLDAACEPRWKIAAAVGLKERQVYNRLRQIREKRELARAVQSVMDDDPRYS